MTLSQRQAECLLLAGQGYTSKEIARSIGISPSTVDNHIGAAIDRLGARNRAEAARFMLMQTSSDPAEAALLVGASRRPVETGNPLSAAFVLPPLGGAPNRIPQAQRLVHILQIAALAIALCSAAILTIAGVVHVLS